MDLGARARLVSGTALTLYSLSLLHEWLSNDGDGDGDGDGNDESTADAAACGGDPADVRTEEAATLQAAALEFQVERAERCFLEQLDETKDPETKAFSAAPATGAHAGEGSGSDSTLQLQRAERAFFGVLEEANAASGDAVAAESSTSRTPQEHAPPANPPSPGGGQHQKNLILICVLGSLNDLSVQTALLMSGVLRPQYLALGVLAGSCAVAALCMCAAMFEPVVRFVQKIPLWAIIAGFAL